jgi:hypothetical protein
VPTAFDSFMSVIRGPDYREVLRAALGPDSVAHAEQQSLLCPRAGSAGCLRARHRAAVREVDIHPRCWM